MRILWQQFNQLFGRDYVRAGDEFIAGDRCMVVASVDQEGVDFVEFEEPDFPEETDDETE